MMIRRYVTLFPRIDRDFTLKTFRFSSLNYLASLVQSIPTLVMPILIVNLISPENAALYYIAFTIGNLVLIIPDAITTSFFVEGSHGINLRWGATRTLLAIYAFLIPAVFFILFFGEQLLGIFGNDYLGALDLLMVVAVSSIFVTIYNVFLPIQNIRLHVGNIVVINLVRFMLLLGLSYIFLIRFGIIGAGYAWLITHAILGLGITVFVKSKRWI
jgi:O-antigen/teichoic acid export membrane protein